MSPSPSRRGLLLGIAAFAIWGVLPLYLKLLAAVSPLQVLAHRILWSLLLLAVMILAAKRLAAIRAALTWRVLALLTLTAGLIAANWYVFIWSVTNGHAIDASLGYFINPLVSVALGVAVLGERLRRWQVAAVGLAGIGVVALAAGGGVAALWIPLTLAVSFGSYGLVRKVVAIDALGGLTIETLLLAPICLAVVVLAAGNGTGAFGHDLRLDLLLVGSGLVTALPLLLFTAAARALPLSTLGLLQYIAPTLQFLEATLLFGEPVRDYQIAAFVLIWSGCGLFAWEGWRRPPAA